MNALRYSKIATTLSLFALLMIFIAPIVSQALMRHEYTPAAQTHHHQSHGKPDAQPLASSGMAIDHDACGYCALLSHHPPLFSYDSPLLAPRFIARGQADEQRLWHRVIAAHYYPQSPRAPPDSHITQQ